MNQNKYSVVSSDDHKSYQFYSLGPKGQIKKVVYYQKLRGFGESIFNLSFGDWIQNEKRVDDKIISNNKDREKILATVAWTVLDFTNYYPDAIIYVEGSTQSRTRLYQMGISAYWAEISTLFEIVGFVESNWEPFKRSRNFEAFAVRVKK